MRPHRRPSTRLLCPWDSPGKNTGVDCHFLLQCMKVKSESEVTQSYPTHSDPLTVAYQASLSMGFSRQKYRRGLPSSPLGGPPDPGIKPASLMSPALIGDFFTTNVTYAKLLQSFLTLCDPIDGSPPGSPVPGILQARTLEWTAISFSNA